MNFVRDALDLQVQVDAIGLGAIFALMAVGIGLVFGVMRLVNFAYGQLIMAGAFALAYASDRDWPVGVGIAGQAISWNLTIPVGGRSDPLSFDVGGVMVVLSVMLFFGTLLFRPLLRKD